MAFWGVGGVGKTQIALQYAFKEKNRRPGCHVFWIPAIRVSTFEKAYLDIRHRLKIPGISDNNTDVKALVQEKLSDEASGNGFLSLISR